MNVMILKLLGKVEQNIQQKQHDTAPVYREIEKKHCK